MVVIYIKELITYVKGEPSSMGIPLIWIFKREIQFPNRYAR